MFSYSFYKVLHLAALFGMLLSLGGVLFDPSRSKKWGMFLGTSGLIMLVAGFGLIARLGVGFPAWVIGKLVIWLVIVAVGSMAGKRWLAHRPQLLVAFWTLASVAALLAIFKP